MSDEELEETTSTRANETKTVSYPLKIVYCPECSLPLEFCEFMPESVLQHCKAWREKNHDLLEQEGVSLASLNLDDAAADKKRQKRGGRGNIKSKPKKEPDVVKLARIPRGKRKYVTRVTGLATFDINLKKASKLFAQKFSCGSSVSGEDEIIVQGDVTDELIDLILETFEIDEDRIEDLGEVKR